MLNNLITFREELINEDIIKPRKNALSVRKPLNFFVIRNMVILDFFRYINRNCLFETSILKSNRLEFDEFLFLAYLIIVNGSYKQITDLIGFSNRAFAIGKQMSRELFINLNIKYILIGGPKVQVNETVLRKRCVILNNASTFNETKDTVWILGIIDTKNKNNFYVTRVTNRKIVTITRT